MRRGTGNLNRWTVILVYAVQRCECTLLNAFREFQEYGNVRPAQIGQVRMHIARDVDSTCSSGGFLFLHCEWSRT